MNFSADLSTIQIASYKNRFSVIDRYNGEEKVVFAGNLKVPQHEAFLANILRILPALAKVS